MIENLSHSRIIQLVETLTCWWTVLQPELRFVRQQLHAHHKMRDFKFLALSKGPEKGLQRQVNGGTTSKQRNIYPPKSPSLTDVSLIGSSSATRLRDQSPPAGLDEYKKGGRRRSRSGGSVSTLGSASTIPASQVSNDFGHLGELAVI